MMTDTSPTLRLLGPRKPPPPVDHPTPAESFWICVAMAFCGGCALGMSFVATVWRGLGG